MNSKDYWEKRALQREAEAFIETAEAVQRQRGLYDAAAVRLVKAVKIVFANFMKLSGVDEDEARRLLTVPETAELLWQLQEEYTRTGNTELLGQLNAPSYAYRISRVQALRKTIEAETASVAAQEQKIGEAQLVKAFDDSYYKTMYDTAAANDSAVNFAALPQEAVTQAVENKWKGENYSSRVWKNRDVVAQEAGKIIDSGIAAGASVYKMADELKDLLNVGAYASQRLIRTETNRMHNDAALAAYGAMGVQEYRYLATLDARTCSICGALDGKHFPISDAKTGVNFPPMHPNDRCTTVPYDLDEELDGVRMARDPTTGKNYKVPEGMTYEQWRRDISEKYGAGTLEKAQKMLMNRKKDADQLEAYKKVLGKDAPGTLAEFQDMKYSDSKEYGVVKAKYRGMQYYNRAVKNEPDITKAVLDIAGQTGMQPAGLEFRIKGKESFLRKVEANYKPAGNEYEVKDILRYTVTAGPEELTDKALQNIDAFEKLGYNTIEVKNYWLDKRNPYNGINTVVKAPNGQKFELQYHTPESYAVKDRMHGDYEKWRLLDPVSLEAQELNESMHLQSESMKTPREIERVKKR